ncbi:MAG: hypothetical protein QNJ45_08830 [Ardenticatenaceae bacterium]|nr:hypothetical protein [Ardenticatenaceae bacterium]
MKSFGVQTPRLLNRGMEAAVYAWGNDAVIKLYRSTTWCTPNLNDTIFWNYLG